VKTERRNATRTFTIFERPHLSATWLIHVGVRVSQVAGLPLSGNPA